MKRKTLIVLLVLLLVGILAFTVFACNNNKKPDNPNTGTTPGGDGPGDDDDPPEEETYAIVEALPKLVTGLDKVAATVGDINEGKAAYLGADIGLNFGLTADGLDVAADLVLSLKVSVDEKTSANNWALIGLKSDKKDVAQLFLTVEDDVEKIYIKEALTGSNNWKLLSVLDTKETDLEGLFTGDNYGLIDKLFGLISGLAAEDSTFPIDFGSATPISGIEFMEGFSLNSILGLVNGLELGELLDGVLHAEAYDNGSGYTAELNRTGISALLTKLGPTITGMAPDLDLYGMLRGLNPILSMVLGMSVNAEEDTFDIDDKANPKLTIDFNINDDAALENLSINFNNPDIEGLGIELGVAIKNIEIAGEAKEPTEVSGYEKLGLNLELQAKLPKWAETASAPAATIAVSVDPDATIGWDKNGKIKIDLSNIKGYATFNGETIAEYKTHNNEKGFAIDLAPVYDFIAPKGTGDQRANVYFINCDLDAIINGTKAEGGSQLSNAAYADGTGETTTPTLTGTLGKLITAIKAGVKLTNIGDVIGPILTDNNNLVGMLLDLLGTNGAIGLDPALGKEPDGDIKVTVDADKLVDFAMGDNLLGGIESMINITLYDVAAAQEAIDPALSNKEAEVNKKQPITLSKIFEGDLVDVIIDLVYTAMYDNYEKTNPDVTFAQYVKGGDIIYNRDAIAGIADHLGFDLSGGEDAKFDAADLGNIVATINYGDSLSAKLEVLGAYIQIGADLDTYKAPTASIDTKDAEPMGEYIDGKLVVAFNGSKLETALLELAGYALKGQKDLFLQTSAAE